MREWGGEGGRLEGGRGGGGKVFPMIGDGIWRFSCRWRRQSSQHDAQHAGSKHNVQSYRCMSPVQNDQWPTTTKILSSFGTEVIEKTVDRWAAVGANQRWRRRSMIASCLFTYSGPSFNEPTFFSVTSHVVLATVASCPLNSRSPAILSPFVASPFASTFYQLQPKTYYRSMQVEHRVERQSQYVRTFCNRFLLLDWFYIVVLGGRRGLNWQVSM